MRPKPDADRRIAALAGRQHGVVARSQLLRLGVSAEAIKRRVTAGRLHPLHRGVFAVGHRVLTVEGRWMAATLATAGALSHATAAGAWGLRRRASGLIHVTATSARRRAGVKVHRNALAPQDSTTYRGIPITTPARTIIDLARTLEGRPLEDILDFAELRGLVDFAGFANRPIPPSLQAVLSLYTAGSTVTRSDMENRFLQLCDDHGIPRPIANSHVEGEEVDFVWREHRVVVEVDGYRYHRAPSRFESDRERDVMLTVAGWEVLRFTWTQLTTRPAWVAAAVKRVIGNRRQHSG
jgi:REase_MTES_1575/Transcriptional regulator, AbiEi antitoxin